MNRSPIYPRLDTSDYSGNEFDYQADFTQLLEEAKKNASQENSDTAQLQAPGMEQFDAEKKNRKSWKSSLFSWLNTDKKSKSSKQLKNGAAVPKPRRAHVSGPVQFPGRGVTRGRSGRAASCPLASFFASTKRVEEYEAPYMCLSKITNPQKPTSFGPVYLVT